MSHSAFLPPTLCRQSGYTAAPVHDEAPKNKRGAADVDGEDYDVLDNLPIKLRRLNYQVEHLNKELADAKHQLSINEGVIRVLMTQITGAAAPPMSPFVVARTTSPSSEWTNPGHPPLSTAKICPQSFGVNTVAGSLKNPNLQIRPDPPVNLHATTGPFNQNSLRLASVASQTAPLVVATGAEADFFDRPTLVETAADYAPSVAKSTGKEKKLKDWLPALTPSGENATSLAPVHVTTAVHPATNVDYAPPPMPPAAAAKLAAAVAAKAAAAAMKSPVKRPSAPAAPAAAPASSPSVPAAVAKPPMPEAPKVSSKPKPVPVPEVVVLPPPAGIEEEVEEEAVEEEEEEEAVEEESVVAEEEEAEEEEAEEEAVEDEAASEEDEADNYEWIAAVKVDPKKPARPFWLDKRTNTLYVPTTDEDGDNVPGAAFGVYDPEAKKLVKRYAAAV